MFKGVEAAHGALYSCSQLGFAVGWHIGAHAHEWRNELIVVVQGRHRVEMEGRVYEAVPGDVLNYPAMVVHEEWSVGDEPLGMLYFSWLDAGESKGRDMPRYVHDTHGRVRFLGQWMLDLKAQSPDAPSTAEMMHMMLGLMLKELRQVRQPAPDERLERVRRHIHTRLSESVSIDELSKVAGLSRFHLIRVFRARYGVTPMEYLRQQRVETARIMVRSSGQNLKQIASMVGFSDEFHLSKVFKAAVGVSPSEYRKMGESYEYA